MKRLFWLGVGIAVGALVVRQLSRTAHAYSPSGLAESARNSAAGLWESVQDFVADIREGMAEREEEIQMAFAQGVSLGDLDADALDEDELYDDLEYGLLDENETDDESTEGPETTGQKYNGQGNGAGVRR
jgi:hypothetical protein